MRQPKLSALQNANSDCRQTSLYRVQFYNTDILEFAISPIQISVLQGQDIPPPSNQNYMKKTVRLLKKEYKLVWHNQYTTKEAVLSIGTENFQRFSIKYAKQSPNEIFFRHAKRHPFGVPFGGGQGWIRTTEVSDVRFTV